MKFEHSSQRHKKMLHGVLETMSIALPLASSWLALHFLLP
jgi:hypothetical protein